MFLKAAPHPPVRARLYRTVRSAHLERAHELTPATIIYRLKRYDFQDDLVEGLDLVQAGPVRAAWRLARSRVTELEVNEPLMLASSAGTALAIMGFRIGAFLTRRRVLVVSYAIENVDPFAARPQGVRARFRRVLRRSQARFIWHQLDRVAFGTEAARRIYRNALPAPRLRTDTAMIAALPAPCGCPAANSRPASDVVFLGALSARKGFPAVLEAWPLVRQAVPAARLSILGQGELESLAQAAATADPSIHVVINPDRAEIHRRLRRNRTLLLPSQPTATWREQVGLPIVEGLAHGCEIVTTSQTGLADWLAEHGHSVIPAGAPAELLAIAIISSLRQPRSSMAITAALPSTDGRLEADAWLFNAR